MAGYNKYQGQIQGPFKANQELIDLIEKQCISRPLYLWHVGIQTATDNVVIHPSALVQMTIFGKPQTIEVGKTNVYEIGNTKVTSIKFLEDKDNNTIVDYIAIFSETQEEEDSGSVMD